MEKIAFLNDPTIIASVITGVFALFSGIMALYIYRSKKKLEVKLNRELENHKSWLEGKNKEIQSQLDTKLELLRIEYGTVFIKRLEVIEEIYDNLLQIQELCTKLYLHDKSKVMDEENAKRLKKISDNFRQFESYFERKKLYLSEDLANTIRCFITITSVKLYEKYPDEINRHFSVSGDVSEEELSAFVKKFLNIAEELKPTEILNALENEFRTLIGVEVTSNHARTNL
ncbi:MAG: hypothetical protein FWC34_05725 [Bacteroidetes bacterium]|nr:hypothetical protein [Bacteroidota bacterium]MCL2302471.1 hypothetical protein [Lentimicrobiaceae bacterium]